MLLVAAAIVGEKVQRARHKAGMDTIAGMVAPQGSTPAAASDRKVYPYSIIEGGARTVDELRKAIERDPVVARHFEGFDLARTRVETLQTPKVVHVSYRRGDDVFWTRRKVVIPAGETVLTDGDNFARTRCGNCLSATPGPVSADEPDPVVLDTPISVAPLQLAGGALTGGQIPAIAGSGSSGSMASSSGVGSPTGGGIGGPSGGFSGSTASSGAATGSTGRQPGADETGSHTPGDPGDPGNPGSNGPGSGGSGSGSSGSGGSGSGGPGNQGGTPGNPQGAPGGPSNNPLVPPPFQGDPGGPLLPPIDLVVPPGTDPLNAPIAGQTLPPGGGLGNPGVQGDPNDPNDPNDPSDPNDLNPTSKQQLPPTESIPEPGTTALMLVAGAYVARRLRRQGR